MAERSDLQVLGGMFLNQKRASDGSLTKAMPTSFAGYLIDGAATATFVPLEYTARHRRFLDETYFVEFLDTVNNFALMRRELFSEHGLYWNDDIKILGEHEEFYIRLKRLGLGERAVAYTNLLATRHIRETNDAFGIKRERTEGMALAMRSTGHHRYNFIGKRTDILSQDHYIFRMGYPAWR